MLAKAKSEEQEDEVAEEEDDEVEEVEEVHDESSMGTDTTRGEEPMHRPTKRVCSAAACGVCTAAQVLDIPVLSMLPNMSAQQQCVGRQGPRTRSRGRAWHQRPRRRPLVRSRLPVPRTRSAAQSRARCRTCLAVLKRLPWLIMSGPVADA